VSRRVCSILRESSGEIRYTLSHFNSLLLLGRVRNVRFYALVYLTALEAEMYAVKNTAELGLIVGRYLAPLALQ
jgi:hypothetical protein